MLQLNRAACEEMLSLRTNACTDVTGFGLLGHAREMAKASNVTLEIEPGLLRVLPGALEYATAGALPGGLNRNREFVSPHITTNYVLSPEMEALLYDPQTSGGLLIAMHPQDAERMNLGHTIGRVIGRTEKDIHLV